MGSMLEHVSTSYGGENRLFKMFIEFKERSFIFFKTVTAQQV
jgi:hypothetical protein